MRNVYGKDFASVYNEKWAFCGPKIWPFLQKTVHKVKRNASTWLDLCCGTGSLLKLASQNGFSVTGVDLSPHQIRHARHDVPDAQFVCKDIRSLSVAKQFDVITCMFIAVGKDLKWMLINSGVLLLYEHEFGKLRRLRQKECPVTVIIIESDKL
jgi:SAM-dependent methyltransferase